MSQEGMSEARGSSPTDGNQAAAAAAPENGPALVAQARGSLRKTTLKLAVLVAAVAGCVVVIHFTPVKEYLQDIQGLKRQVEETGAWAPAVFFAGGAVLVAVGVPRLLFAGLGGLLFGFWLGLLLSVLGPLVGSYSTFLFARWSGRDWVARRFSASGRWRSAFDHPGVVDVFWIRQLPLTGAIITLLLGLTAVRHRIFLVGSFLGFLPTAAIVALVGSGLGEKSWLISMAHVSLALVGVGVLLLSLLRFRRKLRQNGPASVPDPTRIRP